ncbi:hypothetical protein KC19_4G225000 [Ceratodon purpureus]|uniref:SOSS complex subunit B homolog n=1 Tax=Ceratodon purpureus TaxID=3225 RepID=A0A8T0IE03_CERPU|nr:hypothetical protein KC19_4G225000 [Ceratodon purpureus]
MSGVPLVQQQGTTPTQASQQIKDLRPSVTTNINLTFIVLEKGPLSRIGEVGPLVSVALVADATAAVHLQLWGPECDAFQPGDIVRLTNGVFSFHKANLVLRAGKKGTLEKSGEFTMVFSENVNMSKLQWVPDPVNAKQWNPVGFNPHSPQGSQYHHGALLGIPRGPFH